MPPILRLLRPKQWTKNLLVFAALIFTASFRDAELLKASLLAFVATCLVSSGSYAANDVLDCKKDKLHPKKKLRPVASGQISPAVACMAGVISVAAGLWIAALVSTNFLSVLLLFVGLQTIYTLVLKHEAVLDVMTLSLLFVGRAALGAIAIDVKISGWLLFCTGALALMLAVAKRRQEFRSLGNESETRSSLKGYTPEVLDHLLVFSAGIAAVGYGVYGIQSETALKHPALILTVPIVIYGILRYLLLVFRHEQGEEPESIVFRDPHMIATLILFLGTAFWVMSGGFIPWL